MQLRNIMAIAGVQAAKLKRRKIIWVVAMGPVGLYLMVAGPAMFLQVKFGSMVPDGISMMSWSVISGFGRILSNAGQLLALVLGALTVSGDIQDGTLFPALAKPVSRLEVLSGKVLGSAAVMGVFLAVEAVLLGLSMTQVGVGAEWDQMVLFLFSDMLVFVVCLCCGAMAGQVFRPAVGVALILGLGVVYSFWPILIQQSGPTWYGLGAFLLATFPSIEEMALNTSGANSSELLEPAMLRIAYALTWSALFAWLALWRFESRDLTR